MVRQETIKPACIENLWWCHCSFLIQISSEHHQEKLLWIALARFYVEIRHYSSSVGRSVLHLSFKTKYCHEIFYNKPVEKRCEEIFREVSEQHQWFLQVIGFDKDHVHMIIDAETKGQKDVAKALKGTSGRRFLQEFPYLKKTYLVGSGPCSLASYFDNFSERTIIDIDGYVCNQRIPK